jgi:hypothetical protein
MNKTRSAGRDGLANSAGEIATIALYGEFGPPILTAARSFSEAGLETVVLGIGSGKPSVWSNAVSRAELMRPDDVGTPAGTPGDASRLSERYDSRSGRTST